MPRPPSDDIYSDYTPADIYLFAAVWFVTPLLSLSALYLLALLLS